ncbi:MAG: folylpolyglutamate synthase/dihydrofolate synthase family protein [Dehalococcoidia bacterium]|nr:folylpolyglutamate synthase/dihydrofolate synthase family protein [Dehalococcoidia bacterium]
MNYPESVDYLLSFADFERSGRFQDRPDMEPVLALLRRLGDPHLGRDTVHIAGSKGKGSVAAMVESVLRAAGHTSGLFTSPHLHSYTERIRVNGEPLAEDAWVRLTGVLRAAVGAEPPAPEGRRLVTFDLLTALAFLAFREGAVRCQVLEVGLGGRVDSTNVFERKEVCAITAIGLEHTDVLGDTVEEIAGEKAGIVTPGAEVVIGPQPYPAARKVIRRAAAEAGCPIVDVSARYSWRLVSHDLDGQTFGLRGTGGPLRLRIPLLGEHQLENAATAVACIDALRRRGLGIPDAAVERGLAEVRWPGRMEILRRKPVVVADGAHSRDSARRLRESLTRYLSCRSAFLIVGMSAGKDAIGLAEELAPVASGVITVRADHPRAMPPQEAAAAFRRAGVDAEVGQGVAAALDGALAVAAGEGVICLTGSLFVVTEGRAHLHGLAATV